MKSRIDTLVPYVWPQIFLYELLEVNLACIYCVSRFSIRPRLTDQRR